MFDKFASKPYEILYWNQYFFFKFCHILRNHLSPKALWRRHQGRQSDAPEALPSTSMGRELETMGTQFISGVNVEFYLGALKMDESRGEAKQRKEEKSWQAVAIDRSTLDKKQFEAGISIGQKYPCYQVESLKMGWLA